MPAPTGRHDLPLRAEPIGRVYHIEPPDGHPGGTDFTAVPGVAGVAVHGQLDLASRPRFDAALTVHLAGPQLGRPVLLDLQDMTFCDVAGLRSLSIIDTYLTTAGAYLQVIPPTALSGRRTLHLAVASGWLPAEFAPIHPFTGAFHSPAA